MFALQGVREDTHLSVFFELKRLLEDMALAGLVSVHCEFWEGRENRLKSILWFSHTFDPWHARMRPSDLGRAEIPYGNRSFM